MLELCPRPHCGHEPFGGPFSPSHEIGVSRPFFLEEGPERIDPAHGEVLRPGRGCIVIELCFQVRELFRVIRNGRVFLEELVRDRGAEYAHDVKDCGHVPRSSVSPHAR